MRKKDKLLHIQKLNEDIQNVNKERYPELELEDVIKKLNIISPNFENDENFVKGVKYLTHAYNQIFDYGHGETHGY